MNDSTTDDIDPASAPAIATDDQLPDDLPPIEPPSAGFIMQLFVVPAIIVAIIIGLWLLFGKMVAEDQDVPRVLMEIKSSNTLRRGPAMHKLAQLLQIDAKKIPAERQYVNNKIIAGQTASLLKHWLKNIPAETKKKNEVLDAQVFLTRALAWFETPAEVLPVLRQAMNILVEPSSGDRTEQTVRDLQQAVRESAMASIAIIAERQQELNKPLEEPDIVDDLIDIALNADEEARVRRVAAFCLGLFPSEKSKEKLTLILITADAMTRLNAAVGLARQHSTAGIIIFEEILTDALKPYKPELTYKEPTAEELKKATNSYNYEQRLKLKNTLLAVGELSGQWDTDQSARLIKLIEPIAEQHEIDKLSTMATETLTQLKKTPAKK